MAKARATIPRYPKAYPRPLGAIRVGVPSWGGIEPLDPIKRVWDQANHLQVLLGHVSRPLADSYRMELGPPLGLPVNNSLETSCSSPPRVAWHFPPLPPCEGATNRHTKKSSRPYTAFYPRSTARGLPFEAPQSSGTQM
jgi:hypothetical protein